MKIRIIGGDRLVLANDGLRVLQMPNGSTQDVEFHVGEALIEAGWAVLALDSGAETKVVAPAHKKRR